MPDVDIDRMRAMKLEAGARPVAHVRQSVAMRRRRDWLRGLLAVLLAGVLLSVAPGCGGRRPGGPGVIHHVAAGENLYRIGKRYGVPPKRSPKPMASAM